MRPSVPLELPQAKGHLSEAGKVCETKVPSGRQPPLLARICATEPKSAAATLAAAETEGSFSCWCFARNISRTSLLTAELSGAHAGV